MNGMKRAELVEVLEHVSHGLASSDLVPIYKCFSFNGESVRAYNDVVGIEADCLLKINQAVNGNALLQLLKASAKDGEIEITPGINDTTFKIGRSTFKLPWMPNDD